MKKFIVIPLAVVATIAFVILINQPRMIKVIKFQNLSDSSEPSEVVVGAIEVDFDHSGTSRSLTNEEFQKLDLSQCQVEEIILDSRSKALTWINYLSRKNALHVSEERVMELFKNSRYTHVYDYIVVEDNGEGKS